MYAQVENNPRDRFKKPVYWIVLLVFLCSLVPWQKMPEYWRKDCERMKKEAFFTAEETDKVWKIYDDVLAKAESLGKNYTPENFFQDRNILVPLKYKFQKAISYEGKSNYPNRNIIALSKMCEGLIDNLYLQAKENFPCYMPEAVRISREEQMKNEAMWHKAETEAPVPAGCEPIHISGWVFLGFCKWLTMSYLRFLPFALVLILFQLWRKKQSIFQELALRPWFFFFKVLQGPVGIAVYAGIEPAVEWQFAKLCANYMRQNNKWRLTDEEEKNLWIEACKRAEITPEIITQRSKLALASGYLLMILSAPFITAASGAGFLQKPAEQVSVQVSEEQEKSISQWLFVFVDAILPVKVELQVNFKPAARVKQKFLPAIVAEKRWFLPPILAPPLRRR